MPEPLTFEAVRAAVTGTAAAFRCVVEYEPAGGKGDKVFPPTYERGDYADENRQIDGKAVPCVLLDSVQSQANRMELALLDAWERKKIPLPVITVDFSGSNLPKPLRITSLEAPHRIADAILRDSLLGKTTFRKSEVGKKLDHVSNREATALFNLCPTALVFGMWDSTGPKGGLGAKFARALVSEIVGVNFEIGRKTSSRIDPAEIRKGAGPVFRDADGGMTVFEEEAKKIKGKAVLYGRDSKGKEVLYEKGKEQDQGSPSAANHGNVPPSIAKGSVTIDKAVQTTVLSLPALRRLRFPLNGQGRSMTEVDDAARTALAALALCAAALNQAQGCDLRSRCQLHPTTPFVWQLLDEPGATPLEFTLRADDAVVLFKTAVERAKQAGLPWLDEELVLIPSPQLAELVRLSQALAAAQPGDSEGVTT